MAALLSDSELIARARAVVHPRRLSPVAEAGQVGCALLTEAGAVHVGVCIDATSGIGFCAEHAAIASMITHGESRVLTIVAVSARGFIMAPCGRCREFLCQADPGNAATRVLLPEGKVATLRELLPDHWLLDQPARWTELA